MRENIFWDKLYLFFRVDKYQYLECVKKNFLNQFGKEDILNRKIGVIYEWVCYRSRNFTFNSV